MAQSPRPFNKYNLEIILWCGLIALGIYLILFVIIDCQIPTLLKIPVFPIFAIKCAIKRRPIFNMISYVNKLIPIFGTIMIGLGLAELGQRLGDNLIKKTSYKILVFAHKLLTWYSLYTIAIAALSLLNIIPLWPATDNLLGLSIKLATTPLLIPLLLLRVSTKLTLLLLGGAIIGYGIFKIYKLRIQPIAKTYFIKLTYYVFATTYGLYLISLLLLLHFNLPLFDFIQTMLKSKTDLLINTSIYASILLPKVILLIWGCLILKYSLSKTTPVKAVNPK